MKEKFDNCFVCGSNNPIGLKMVFAYQKDMAEASFKLPAHFEGYDNIIHGGIVAAILDEAMAKAILAQDIRAVTVTITIDFKNPLKPGNEYWVQGKILNIKKRIIETEAVISSEDTIYAKATAKFFQIQKKKAVSLLMVAI